MATQITTGKVRFSFCNLFTPRAAQAGAQEKYSVLYCPCTVNTHLQMTIKARTTISESWKHL